MQATVETGSTMRAQCKGKKCYRFSSTKCDKAIGSMGAVARCPSDNHNYVRSVSIDQIIQILIPGYRLWLLLSLFFLWKDDLSELRHTYENSKNVIGPWVLNPEVGGSKIYSQSNLTNPMKL